jgi:hypothetical protein
MEGENGSEHLGNELLGEDKDYLEIEPEAPDTKVPDIAERNAQILTTNRKEGIFDTCHHVRDLLALTMNWHASWYCTFHCPGNLY